MTGGAWRQHRHKRALVVLPYIALVEEKVAFLERLCAPVGLSVRGHAGSKGGRGVREDIAVCTIEKANGIVNAFVEAGRLEVGRRVRIVWAGTEFHRMGCFVRVSSSSSLYSTAVAFFPIWGNGRRSPLFRAVLFSSKPFNAKRPPPSLRCMTSFLLQELTMVVVDEIHSIDDSSRGYLLELLLTKLLYTGHALTAPGGCGCVVGLQSACSAFTRGLATTIRRPFRGESLGCKGSLVAKFQVIPLSPGSVEVFECCCFCSVGRRPVVAQCSHAANPDNIQIVGMSATLPNAHVLAKWLHDATFFVTNFRPVPLTEYFKVGPTVYGADRRVVRTVPGTPEDPDHVAAYHPPKYKLLLFGNFLLYIFLNFIYIYCCFIGGVFWGGKCILNTLFQYS